MSSYNIPLVADIHFAPSVALRVAECFEKIRVNPGNFGMLVFVNSFVVFFPFSFKCWLAF
jgi:4-hydroxy-3-methylbut-2-en-1-yl diphosphate synthase IspG/GcpE